MTVDEGDCYIFTFCCDNLRKSKFMALERPGKLTEFFLILCGLIRSELWRIVEVGVQFSFLSPKQQHQSTEGFNDSREHTNIINTAKSGIHCSC